MAATTYSTGYQIKLIGTGQESTTWGTSTNENLERIEDALGGTVVIDVTDPPTGSTWTASTNTLVWVTQDTAASGMTGFSPGERAATSPPGSGRARYVVFADDTTPSGAVTIKICGNTSGYSPDRVFFVKNALTEHDINFYEGSSGSTPYLLGNGRSAILYCSAVAKGASSSGAIAINTVDNILDNFQVSSLDVTGAGGITLSNDETITNAADGIVVIDGVTLKTGSGGAAAVVTSSGDYDLTLQTGNSTTGSITIVDGVDGEITLAPNGAGVVAIDGAATGLDVRGSAGITLENDETITNSSNGIIAFGGATTATGDVSSAGDVNADGDIIAGDGSAAGTFKSNGNRNVVIKTGNATTGTMQIINGADGDIEIFPNGSTSSAGVVAVSTAIKVPRLSYIPTAVTTNGYIYAAQEASADTELYYKNGTGAVKVSNVIPSGTVMIFVQASPPTGWTLIDTDNDRVPLFTDNSGGSDPGEEAGGTTGGNWTLSGIVVDDHELSAAEIPEHTHFIANTSVTGNSTSSISPTLHMARYYDNGSEAYKLKGTGTVPTLAPTDGGTGGGDGHTHGLTNDASWRPKYITVIKCSKD